MSSEKRARSRRLYRYCCDSDPRVEIGRKTSLIVLSIWVLLRGGYFAVSLMQPGNQDTSLLWAVQSCVFVIMALFALYLYFGIGRFYPLVPAVVGGVSLWQKLAMSNWKSISGAETTAQITLIVIDCLQILLMLFLVLFPPYARYCKARDSVDRQMRRAPSTDPEKTESDI